MLIPDEARNELKATAFGITTEMYVDLMWERRVAGSVAVAKSSAQWPFRRVDDQTNLVAFPATKKVKKP